MKGIILGCAVLAGCVWFWKEVKKTSVRSVSGKMTPEGKARMDKINAILLSRTTDNNKLARLVKLGMTTAQAIKTLNVGKYEQAKTNKNIKINAILNTRATDSQKLAKLINLGVSTERAVSLIEIYNHTTHTQGTAPMSDCVYPESTESEREAIRKYNRQMSAERREHNRWEKDKIEGTGRYHLLTKV